MSVSSHCISPGIFKCGVGVGTVDDFLDAIETATDDCQVIKARREQKNR